MAKEHKNAVMDVINTALKDAVKNSNDLRFDGAEVNRVGTGILVVRFSGSYGPSYIQIKVSEMA